MSEEIKFSKSQLKAIETKNKTLLVSAGAGSGKTTVLTQRIIEKLKNGADIDSILVVTYTKAAAATLRDKLYDKLLKASAENPSDKRLSRTLYRIPSARISTIHSFCLDLIKSNFSLLSLPPSMRVADEAESGILFGNCLEDLIDESFESGSEGFLNLCNAFSGEKSLDSFKTIVERVYKKYRSFPFWRNYIRTSAEIEVKQAETAVKNSFLKTEAGIKLLATLRGKIAAFHDSANSLYMTVTYAAHRESHIKAPEYIADKLCSFESMLKKEDISYSEIKTFFDSFDSPRAYTKGLPEEVAVKYKRIKNGICDGMELFQTWFDSGEAEAAEDYRKAVELNLLMNGFIISLDEKYAAAKKTRGILDFPDLEQFTLTLLGEPTPGGVVRTKLCGEIRNGLEEIYIDEYQDVNPLQDMIFSLLAKPDNRFMVGDVKQSIYRFRNASADIFLGYLSAFPPLGESGVEAKIFLSENHRSRKPILDFVNLLFDSLYTEENVNASYKEERLIYPGEATPDSYPVCVNVFGESDNPNADEAAYVADTIYRLVNEPGYGEKAYAYGDIALILRSVATSGGEYEHAFASRGIPYSVEKARDFLLEPEVLLALSILRVMDNPLDDISLAAAMRSPVFGFSADDLYSVKRSYACESLYDCVRRCASDYGRLLNAGKRYRADKNFRFIRRVTYSGIIRGKPSGGKPDTTVRKKCWDFLDRLEKLRRPGTECPSSRLIWEMYIKTGLVSLCAAENNGARRKNNLYTLYRYALDFEKTSFKGLSSFLSYIKDVADSYGADMTSENGEENKVKIMSVHKSKGMEFPVCFVSSLGRKFNDTDIKAKFIVRGDGFTFYNLRSANGLAEYTPLVKIAAASDEKKVQYREELRCLYVALTRAEERLYVTGVLKSKTGEDDYGAEGKGFFEAANFMDWICPVLRSKPDLCFTLRNEAQSERSGLYIKPEEKKEYIPDGVFMDAVGFVYPYGSGWRVPAKAAVSELRKGILEDDEYTRSVSSGEAGKKPCFIAPDRDYASIGTATHLFMQFADFENAVKNGVAAETERLVGIKMLSPGDASLIDVKAVERFFASPLMKQMSSSKAVWREKRFNLIEKSSLISDEGSENVMIQGVIDCFFRNPDGTFTVLDYKTDRIPRENGEAILAARHSTQIRYYCRAAEMITGGRVSRAVLYSFSLGREIEVPYEG